MTQLLFSCAPETFADARRELNQTQAESRVARMGDDVGTVEAAALTIEALAEQCRQRPLAFIQRLATVHVALAMPVGVAEVAAASHTILREHQIMGTLALQLWGSSDLPAGAVPLKDWWAELAADLEQHGWHVVRAGQPHVLSVCVTATTVLIGVDQRNDILADWPGGRVHLAARPEQISRAELKLEELVQLGAFTWPDRGEALDLGASPGGWTRQARLHGMTVWAVDPATLDPRLAHDRGIIHIRETAQQLLAITHQHFDLLLNDMRMDGDRSAALAVEAAPLLRSAGRVIMTVKVSIRETGAQLFQVFAILRQAYTIEFARHLFHNRHEVTLVARLRDRQRERSHRP